jgi:hypothetical protein
MVGDETGKLVNFNDLVRLTPAVSVKSKKTHRL